MASLIYWLVLIGVFILLCKFNLIKWTCFAFSILLALYATNIGLILIYANPMLRPGMPIQGEPLVPFAVGLVAVLAAVAILFSKDRPNQGLPANVSPGKWGLWIGGLLLPLGGIVLFFMAVYAPSSLGGAQPMTGLGAWMMALGTTAGVVLLYYASTFNTQAAPNRMRWWTLGAMLLLLNEKPFVGSLILIYTVPSTPKINCPVEASWLTLTMIPMALLLLALAWQRVEAPRRKPPAEA